MPHRGLRGADAARHGVPGDCRGVSAACLPWPATREAIVSELIPLRLLPAGQAAEIGQITGDPQHVHRLLELGLRQGKVIEMVQPGSPCIIRLAGQKLCFRPNEALNVLVRPLVAGC